MQMLTQEGANTNAVAVRGNFDDVQSAVKRIFTDDVLDKNALSDKYFLSSANSINISRLIPQIVYYYYAYVKSVEQGSVKAGQAVNFVVPTGNFGNILAGYYAMRTGLPVKKLICASNENNVLTDFFLTGEYDKNRPFKKTISPSMDILISSNLERLIYEISGKDDAKLVELMKELSACGKYTTDRDSAIFGAFYGGYATEAEIYDAIKESYDKYGYVIDTHTACGYKVYKDYVRETKDDAYTVILSTASPYKFSQDVLAAVNGVREADGVKAMYRLSALTGEPVPDAVNGIEKRPMKEQTVIDVKDMTRTVLAIVKGEAGHV
jgi:threonine synthase